MKKVLFSMAAVATVAAVAGVGSWAMFSDSEAAEDSYISAGSLDLLVNGEDLTGTAVFTIENVAPGDSDSNRGTVTNDGSIDGQLSFSVSSIESIENDLIEPEDEDGDVTTTEGELCDETEVKISYDGDVVYDWGSISDIDSTNLGLLGADETKEYTIEYRVKSSADNTIMTDKCVFDMELILDQI